MQTALTLLTGLRSRGAEPAVRELKDPGRARGGRSFTARILLGGSGPPWTRRRHPCARWRLRHVLQRVLPNRHRSDSSGEVPPATAVTAAYDIQRRTGESGYLTSCM
jgi:hypothetical protein